MGYCEKASELTSKKIDIKLSFLEKITLKFHTIMCSACLTFEDEAITISEAIKHEHLNNTCNHEMCKNSKESLKELLKNKY